MKIASAATLIDDVRICLAFYTRLPVSYPLKESHSFADAQWAAPVAGAVIGIIAGFVLWLALMLGLPEALAIIVALASCMLLTGALHEDGLADVADGFGGGREREKKLEIMRDSRLGSYGALALIVSFAMKITALSPLTAYSPNLAIYALITAHIASRALLPAFIAAVPPARQDGLSAAIGKFDPKIALIAIVSGVFILAFGGMLFAGSAIIALSLLFIFFKNRTMRHIGGQTGDVLGALQQSAEVILYILAVVIFV